MIVEVSFLRAKLKALLRGFTLSNRHTNEITDALIDSEMSGVHTHGLALLPGIIDNLKIGKIDLTSKPTVQKKARNNISIDGDKCFGFASGNLAVKNAISTSNKYGSSIVTIKNMNHWGRASFYAEKIAAAGNIVIILLATSPTMLLHGSKKIKIGNNIFCVSIPTNDHGILTLDLCTSILSYGKVCEMAHAGIESAHPLGINKYGNLTNDPKEIADGGCLLPFSANKGSGLGLMIEFFVTMFTGAYTTCHVEDKANNTRGTNAKDSVFIFSIKKENIPFLSNVDEQINYLKTAIDSANESNGTIYLPGERSKHYKNESQKKGVCITSYVQEILKKNFFTGSFLQSLMDNATYL